MQGLTLGLWIDKLVQNKYILLRNKSQQIYFPTKTNTYILPQKKQIPIWLYSHDTLSFNSSIDSTSP